MKKRCVDSRFFDRVIYSIYSSIGDILKDDAWQIVWKSGEYLLNEIEKEIMLSDIKDVIEGLSYISEWLREKGYIEDIKVIKKSEVLFEYHMLNPTITKAAKELISLGKVPPHISTSLMFAYLKKFNLSAEMIENPIFRDDGYVIEKWRLTKLKE